MSNSESYLIGHKGAVSRVSFSRDAKLLASASVDKTGRVWNLDNPDTACIVLEGHQHGISDICWHPAEEYVATAADDKTLRLWDVESSTSLRTFTGHTHYVFCCKFHCHGNVLISGSLDEAIRLWDVRTAHCIQTIPAHADPVTSVDCTRDGTLLASCSSDGLSRLWDFRTGRLLRTLQDPESTETVTTVQFSPNSHYLLEATLAQEAELRIWDWRRGEGQVVKRFRGHSNATYALPAQLAFGSWAVSASEDGHVFLWHVNSGKVVRRHYELPTAPAALKSASEAAAVPSGMPADVEMKCEGGFKEEAGEAKQAAAQWAPAEIEKTEGNGNGARGNGKEPVGGKGSKPREELPCPCAINAMCVNDRAGKIALSQVGRTDFGITVGDFLEPEA